MTTKLAAHRSAANNSEAIIDGIFMSAEADSIPQMETVVVVDDKPLGRNGESASGREILQLRCRPRA